MFSLENSFVELLNKYRREGESHSSFGRRMGFSHKIFQEWQKGSIPKVDSLRKIREKLSLSKKEYDELFYSVYKIIPQEITRNKNKGQYDILNNIIYARNLPDNYLAKRLLAFKDENETEREFARRLGLPDEIWDGMLETPTLPKGMTADMLLRIIVTLDPRGTRNLTKVFAGAVPGKHDVNASQKTVTRVTGRKRAKGGNIA